MSRLRSSAFALVLAPAIAVAGCGGDHDETPAVTEIPAEAPPPADASLAQETLVEGCLRAGQQPGTFVLAALPEEMGKAADRATRGEVATYTYLLVGDNLGQYAGREVTVRGVIDDGTDVEVDRTSEMEGQPTTVDGDTVTPTVEVEEEAVIDVRRMRVTAVEATGGSCPTS